jgi:hypothetical protein
MNDSMQFANAMLVLVFAAVMLVAGQLYIKGKSSTKSSVNRPTQMALARR